MLWLVAVVAGGLPKRLWHHLEPLLPMTRTGSAAGILTLTLGFVIGVPGFFAYGEEQASANNEWMLRLLTSGSGSPDAALVPYGMSVLTLFMFLFATPTGLLASYLVTSGALRATAAFFDPDDARGDFLLSGIDWTVSTLFRRCLEGWERLARQAREGPETPDRLFTGAWAGVDADYVVVASRRKAEWDPDAIILTSTEWYRLGVPFDLETPSGLRTVYPLTKMDFAEVVRRGIQYELPRLSRDPKPGTQRPQS